MRMILKLSGSNCHLLLMPMSLHAIVLRMEFRFCYTDITFFIVHPYQSTLSNLCQFHLSLTKVLNPQSKTLAPPFSPMSS